jgi:2-keto-4-pentenoate hydratase/2-oxohepta-3-ene-1,7-dioic acid hydratase in catechol pathway
MFQAPSNSGGQYSYAKAFDRFAPLAPIVVNPAHYGSVGEKQLKTTINGKVVQDSPVDLIWGPEKLVSFLSQGTSCNTVQRVEFTRMRLAS